MKTRVYLFAALAFLQAASAFPCLADEPTKAELHKADLCPRGKYWVDAATLRTATLFAELPMRKGDAFLKKISSTDKGYEFELVCMAITTPEAPTHPAGHVKTSTGLLPLNHGMEVFVVDAEGKQKAPILWGCDTNRQCEPGNYCARPAGTCGNEQAQGKCMPKPQVCDQLEMPVKGCDGNVYGNACKAAAAGVNIGENK